MTMQVGMVGTDGVLIASDTRWNAEPRLINEPTGARVNFDSSKLLLDHNRGIAVSCARNMETAKRVAQKIISDLNDEELISSPIAAIEEIGREILGSAGNRNQVHCLIALSRPRIRLFQMQFSIVNGEMQPWCQEMEGSATVGDNTNNAIFWAQRYHSLRPIRELIPLAAHLVMSASKLNSGAISGLEIVVCNSSGLNLLSKQLICDLQLKAEEWDREFGELIFRYGQTVMKP